MLAVYPARTIGGIVFRAGITAADIVANFFPGIGILVVDAVRGAALQPFGALAVARYFHDNIGVIGRRSCGYLQGAIGLIADKIRSFGIPYLIGQIRLIKKYAPGFLAHLAVAGGLVCLNFIVV